jgi:hypothetical protein
LALVAARAGWHAAENDNCMLLWRLLVDGLKYRLLVVAAIELDRWLLRWGLLLLLLLHRLALPVGPAMLRASRIIEQCPCPKWHLHADA